MLQNGQGEVKGNIEGGQTSTDPHHNQSSQGSISHVNMQRKLMLPCWTLDAVAICPHLPVRLPEQSSSCTIARGLPHKVQMHTIRWLQRLLMHPPRSPKGMQASSHAAQRTDRESGAQLNLAHQLSWETVRCGLFQGRNQFLAKHGCVPEQSLLSMNMHSARSTQSARLFVCCLAGIGSRKTCFL